MKKRPEELENGLLNPDMIDQCIRLHMGEVTSDEILVARAAIRWANETINQYLEVKNDRANKRRLNPSY